MALEGKDLIEWDAERRNAAFPALLEWLKEHSIDPEKVEIYYKDATQGFGLKTKVPLSTGDVVFTIPQKAILTSLVARNSKLSEYLKLRFHELIKRNANDSYLLFAEILADKDPLLGGMQNVLLAIYLVHERFTNPNSSWKRYIDSLPRVYETVLYFSKEEMAVLKNSPTAFRKLLRLKHCIKSFQGIGHSNSIVTLQEKPFGCYGTLPDNTHIFTSSLGYDNTIALRNYLC